MCTRQGQRVGIWPSGKPEAGQQLLLITLLLFIIIFT